MYCVRDVHDREKGMVILIVIFHLMIEKLQPATVMTVMPNESMEGDTRVTSAFGMNLHDCYL